MMHVRVMTMTVRQWLVPVTMAVQFTRGIARAVRVPVVLVVLVQVLMLHRFVRVLMLVPLGEVKPHAR